MIGKKVPTGRNGVKKLLFVSLLFTRLHFLRRPPTGVYKLLFVGRKGPQTLKDGKNGIKSLPFFLWSGGV